jgi:hypothetical protein
VKEAAERDDVQALALALDELWAHVYATHERLDAMTEAWNSLAMRAAAARS